MADWSAVCWYTGDPADLVAELAQLLEPPAWHANAAYPGTPDVELLPRPRRQPRPGESRLRPLVPVLHRAAPPRRVPALKPSSGHGLSSQHGSHCGGSCYPPASSGRLTCGKGVELRGIETPGLFHAMEAVEARSRPERSGGQVDALRACGSSGP
jgi:hypothetical protein